MFRKHLVLLFLLFIPGIGLGQISREHFANKKIQKKKWEQAKTLLKKVLSKDSLNVTAQYLMARYFFDQQNPAYQIDSAYLYSTRAANMYGNVSPRQRDRLKRFPVDSLILKSQRERIDSAAFKRAKTINTERAYIDFLTGFPTAVQHQQAIELRDEAAYLNALRERTYLAFENYVSKYPTSIHAHEAKAFYEKLLYEAKTLDARLTSYKAFLESYPQSPYRHDAEKNIFEISTAVGTSVSYQTFLHDYPESIKAERAKNILFHLSINQAEIENNFSVTDSLSRVLELQKHYVVPVLHNGMIGFMNDIGEEIIQPQAMEIADDYRCGNIVEDVLVLPDKIVSLSGSTLYEGNVIAVTDIGSGFLKIETSDCSNIIHKSGFSVSGGCVDDAKVLSGKLLVINKNGVWSVWTFSGRMIIPFLWDDISAIGDVLLFKKGSKLKLATVQSVARTADQQPLLLSDGFDDVTEWPQHHLRVTSDEYQGVLDQNLEVFIRFDKYKLTSTYFGAWAASPFSSAIFNARGEESPSFKQVQIYKPWTAVKTNILSWRLYNPVELKFQSSTYDTIQFVGPFAIGNTTDSLTIHFNPYFEIDFPQLCKLEFVPGQDSTSFLIVENGEIKTLFDGDGRRLFAGMYDRIQYAGKGMFIVSKKEKKGLLDSNGKLVLPIEYDAIGSVKDNTVSILKSMKFGLFDFGKQKLIKPEYLKNVMVYSIDKLVAFKDGLCGLIGWDNKPASRFEFEEIRYWNDTSALVKNSSLWRLYDIRSGNILIDKIKKITMVQDGDREKIAIIQQNNAYGVIHNEKGIIIPANFSDIVNVGSRDLPMYFTEKHVEEASVFVVIYYDHAGQMLRKEVYDHDDYEKIYCSDN